MALCFGRTVGETGVILSNLLGRDSADVSFSPSAARREGLHNITEYTCASSWTSRVQSDAANSIWEPQALKKAEDLIKNRLGFLEKYIYIYIHHIEWGSSVVHSKPMRSMGFAFFYFTASAIQMWLSSLNSTFLPCPPPNPQSVQDISEWINDFNVGASGRMISYNWEVIATLCTMICNNESSSSSWKYVIHSLNTFKVHTMKNNPVFALENNERYWKWS